MKIQFILVEPKVPENIGASARAIKTMGFNSLILVNPFSWKEGKSKWVAHGSAEILDEAKVYPTLKKALEGTDLAIATSAKQRSVKQDYIASDSLAQFITGKTGNIEIVSLVFGREESGLTNDEMALCDVTTSIGMAQPFPSLNLSQAVMLYAYELSELSIRFSQSVHRSGDDQYSYSQLKSKIKTLLNDLGIGEKDNRYGRIMERISFLENDDINLMHSVTSIISSRLKESKQ
jgi:tRNA/rRNA methyltransferase